MLYVTMVSAVIAMVAVWVSAPAEVGKMSAVIGGVFGLVQNGLCLWYFRASKRVNVTYFHRVRAGD